MWPFRRKPDPAPAPTNIDAMAALGEAFAKSFSSQIESNVKIAGIFSGFIEQMGAMSIRSAARAMGERGAAVRKRDGKGKFQPKRKSEFCCPLGENPNRLDVSIEMIKAHRLHESGLESTESAPADANAPEIPTELGN